MICLGEKFSSPSPNSCEHSLMLLLSSDSLLFHGAHERSEDSLNEPDCRILIIHCSMQFILYNFQIICIVMSVLDLMDLTELYLSVFR